MNEKGFFGGKIKKSCSRVVSENKFSPFECGQELKIH
jgi:hypothetical protein